MNKMATTAAPKKSKTTPPARKMGRPALPDDVRLVQRSIRMTEAQWSIVDGLGLEWLRDLVTENAGAEQTA
jgi:hypothetical protein